MNEKTYRQLEELANSADLDTLLDEVNFIERHGVADERGELALFVDEFARRNGLCIYYDSNESEYFTL